MRQIARLLVWLLPASPVKNSLLRSFGHAIAPTAIARSNLVWKVDRFTMAPASSVNRWNVIKGMRSVELEHGSSIGRMNLISAHGAFRLIPSGACLTLRRDSYITSRHEIDCSGSLELGSLAALAGYGSRVLTHSIDLRRNAQTAYPVRVGDRTFIGAQCLLLGGSTLPARSVLAAGSVLPAGERTDPGLWAGVPAKWKSSVDGAWFDREQRSTRDLYVPEKDHLIRKAI